MWLKMTLLDRSRPRRGGGIKVGFCNYIRARVVAIVVVALVVVVVVTGVKNKGCARVVTTSVQNKKKSGLRRIMRSKEVLRRELGIGC